jgi:hypothetical protein
MNDPVRVVSERVTCLDCAQCGAGITVARTGRRPRYCSDTCRKRASEERRAAARLGYPAPVTRVVREVVERVVERTVEPEGLPPTARTLPPPRPPAPATLPRTATEWAPVLRQLAERMRTAPLSVVRSRAELAELADAVAELHAAVQPDPTPPPATASRPTRARVLPAEPDAGLSRQQRRARERERRKQGG